MRSALAGLQPSADFSFDNFGLRPKSSSRFGHGKTSHNPSRYTQFQFRRLLLQKKPFIALAILDAMSLLLSIHIFVPSLLNIGQIFSSDNFLGILLNLLQILLYASLAVSVYFYFKKPIVAVIMYYFQFVLRGLSFVMSFGFLLRINLLFQNDTLYMILAITVSVLEITRLIYTIILNRDLITRN
jgi:hypothetical protein